MPNEAPSLLGHDLFGEPVRRAAQPPLADRFLFPPFSVLNAREGEWQERKRAWLALGVKSELGRDDNALGYPEHMRAKGFYTKKTALEARLGRTLETPEALAILVAEGAIPPADADGAEDGQEANWSGTSIFDPVLCELCYRWFAPPGGLVLDPFAGGSVRGLIAAFLGLRYWGCDLRAEQVAANEGQREELAPGKPVSWVVGDSLVRCAEAPEADFVFTCPPYGDLERYSDDPRDLSTMRYPAFLAAYREIIAMACRKLRPNRFAAIVVSEFRDSAGNYRNFVGHTVDAFRRAGLAYYNEAVLVGSVGSLPVRVGRQFTRMRKLGRTHQTVLVFLKGDAALAAQAVETEAEGGLVEEINDAPEPELLEPSDNGGRP